MPRLETALLSLAAQTRGLLLEGTVMAAVFAAAFVWCCIGSGA